MKKYINISVDIKHEPILQKIQVENNLRSYTQVVDQLLCEKENENSGIPASRFSITNRRYIGSKTKLLNFIETSINEVIGDFVTFIDIFSGTGSVGSHFNKPTNQIIMNDLLYSNYISNTAFLSSESFDYNKIDILIKEFNSLKVKKENYFSKHFGDKFFSKAVARRIGGIREEIENNLSLNFREKAILITSLLYASDKIANTCGHYDAYRSDILYNDNLILKHLDIFHNKNFGNKIYNQDANILVRDLNQKQIDIVYADPPYNSRQYSSAYHVLENLARWDKPKVEGKTSKMVNRKELNSSYCQKSAIEALDDLMTNVNAKYFILSYSDMGIKGNDRSNARMLDDDIISTFKKHGDLEIKTSSHRPFSTGKSSISNHKERLFICKMKP